MEKVLFIIPPYVDYEKYTDPAYNERVVAKKSGNFANVVTDMPIGLLSMSAYLKKHLDVDVRLVDFNVILNKLDDFSYRSFSELYHDYLSQQPEWRDFSPEIVGISTLFTTSYRSMLELAQVVRVLFPTALVVAGGGVPTNLFAEIFASSDCFDALCYGEGEKPLLGLLQAEDKGSFLQEHPSWITREKVVSRQSFIYDFIDDLDEIPFYDYAILASSDYGLSPTISNYAAFDNPQRIFHVVTSRGCTHRCCYCASHSVHGRKMRYHSVERIRSDLQTLKERFGAEIVGFQDDNFMANSKRALEIIHIATALELKIFFQSGLPLYALNRKMLEAIRSAGIKELVLAIESGSNRVLREIMHKPLALSLVQRVVNDCRELGIDADANILIGLPGETKQDIEDTRAFLKTVDVNWFRIYIATPLVGSEMLHICRDKNYLKGDYISGDFKRAVVETEDFTPEYIEGMAYFLNLELNFVCNSDYHLGNYEAALKGFENTIRVKSDHALAYYYAAKCYKELGRDEAYRKYRKAYREIVATSAFWAEYARMFALEELP